MSRLVALGIVAILGSVSLAGDPGQRGNRPPTRPRGDVSLLGIPVFTPGTAIRTAKPFPRPPVSSTPESIYLVFLALERPVMIQISTTLVGRSLGEQWDKQVDRLFPYFDRDGDGYLNGYELESIIPAEGILQLFDGNYYIKANAPPPSMDEIDRDGDGRVSPNELRYHYRDVPKQLVKARVNPVERDEEDPLTKNLFSRLDKNNDGKLSEQELRNAEKLLLSLDQDSDECISGSELLGNDGQPNETGFVRGPSPAPQATTRKATPPQDVIVSVSQPPKNLGKMLLTRYDRDKNGSLSLAELKISKESFDRLDRDKNGSLTTAELDGWTQLSPEAKVTLRLNPEQPGGTTLAQSDRLTILQNEPGRLNIRVGVQTLSFSVVNPTPTAKSQSFQMMVNDIFPDKNKVFTETDLVGPQFQFLRVIFEAADQNGDGRLTHDEFQRYFELQQVTSDLVLSLNVTVRIPNLFQMLDENRDRKLSVRELRTAWNRLRLLQPDGSPEVTRSILQPTVEVKLSPHSLANRDEPLVEPTARPTGAGGRPIWFVRMDLNQDGDVSRAEFLGNADDFRMLDTDSDGLISIEEALQYEKKARPKKDPAKKP